MQMCYWTCYLSGNNYITYEQQHSCKMSQVLTVVLQRIQVCCDVTVCYWLSSEDDGTLKTSGTTNLAIQHQIPEGMNLIFSKNKWLLRWQWQLYGVQPGSSPLLPLTFLEKFLWIDNSPQAVHIIIGCSNDTPISLNRCDDWFWCPLHFYVHFSSEDICSLPNRWQCLNLLAPKFYI